MSEKYFGELTFLGDVLLADDSQVAPYNTIVLSILKVSINFKEA